MRRIVGHARRKGEEPTMETKSRTEAGRNTADRVSPAGQAMAGKETADVREREEETAAAGAGGRRRGASKGRRAGSKAKA